MPYYYLGLALVALSDLRQLGCTTSRIGRAWMAIREDEIAAAAMGVDRRRLKLLAFATVPPSPGDRHLLRRQAADRIARRCSCSRSRSWSWSWSCLGGMGSIWGVVVGALILQLLQSWLLQDLTQWLHALGRLSTTTGCRTIQLAQGMELIFGVILVLMMLYRRQGLIPARRPMPRSVAADEQTAMPSRGGVERRCAASAGRACRRASRCWRSGIWSSTSAASRR